MNTPTPSPAPLSAEEQAELRGWLASPFHGREDDVSSHMADRLLATITAKDETIAVLAANVDHWMRAGANHAQDASDANHRAETAESRVKVLEEALRWATPLAALALETHRCERLRCGHQDIQAKKADGSLVLGLWQDEYDAWQRAESALTPSDQVERT